MSKMCKGSHLPHMVPFFPFLPFPFPNTSNPSIPVKLHSCTKLNINVFGGGGWGGGMALGESNIKILPFSTLKAGKVQKKMKECCKILGTRN